MRLALLLLASLTFILGLRATSPVNRNVPAIYAEKIAPQLTPLAEVLKYKNDFNDEETGIINLLSESVFYVDDKGVVHRALHEVNFLRLESEKKDMATDTYAFDHTTHSAFLVTAATIKPDGTRLELSDQAAFLQTPQRAAENSLYTSETEIHLIYPQLSAGAVTESIVFYREDNPIMPGHFTHSYGFAYSHPVGLRRLVHDFPDDLAKRIQLAANSPEVPSPQEDTYASGRVRRTYERRQIARSRYEERCPEYELRVPYAWFTTIPDWDHVAGWYYKLAEEGSSIGPELKTQIDLWTKDLTDREAIIAAILRVVTEDVRYTGLEFGLAGFKPYACDTVWKNRYGDCKDKANLLRVLLRAKGIPTHLVLIQTLGQGFVEKRSPSWKQFDHAITAIEDGKGGFIFCDPTFEHAPAGVLPFSDTDRDVLVIKEGRAVWAHTPPPQGNSIDVTGDLSIDAAGEVSGWLVLRAFGGDAASYARYYNDRSVEKRRQAFSGTIEAFFPGAELIDLDYKPTQGPVTEFVIRGYVLRKGSTANVGRLDFPFPQGWLPDFTTQGTRVFPYLTTARTESARFNFKLPAQWTSKSIPPNFHSESPQFHFRGNWSVSPGQLTATLSWRPKLSIIAPGDYAAFRAATKSFTAWLETPLLLGESAISASPTASEVSALDFPQLATGSGQLRLLEERYPSSRDKKLRAEAIRRIQQWFPDDLATQFEAAVMLATVDWTNKNDAAVAVEIAAALNRFGKYASTETRAWAEYLECRALWDSAKNPTALSRLKTMASDPSLTAYRRGWAASYAGRWMLETDPAAALTWLQSQGQLQSDARLDTAYLVGEATARLNQPESLRKWCETFLKNDPKLAPECIDKALSRALELVPTLDAAHTAAFTKMAEALAENRANYPATAKLLEKSQQAGAQSLAQKNFIHELNLWLKKNPSPNLPNKKSISFDTLEKVEAELKRANEAGESNNCINAFLQLVLHQKPDYQQFTKYLYWTAWHLREKKLEPDFTRFLALQSKQLPLDPDKDLLDGFIHFGKALSAHANYADAADLLNAAYTHRDAPDYVKTEAAGEIGLNFLAQNQTDSALKWLDLAEKNHTCHKWATRYVATAALVHLELGHLDRGLALLQSIKRQEQKYIDESTHATLLKVLILHLDQPDALKAYWQRRKLWIENWNQLLSEHGITSDPIHQPPVIVDFKSGAKLAQAAITKKDSAAFLRALDPYARLSQWVPIVTNDWFKAFVQAPKTSLGRERMLELIRTVTADAPLQPAALYDDHRYWEIVALLDLNRGTEAYPKCRTFIREYGAKEKTGEHVLNLWLESGSSEALAAARQALAAKPSVPDPLALLKTLSKLYEKKNQPAENLVLLEAERASGRYKDNPAAETYFRTRLDEIRRATNTNALMGTQLKKWLKDSNTSWALNLYPEKLDDTAYATYRTQELPVNIEPHLALKIHLLLALDDTLSPEKRSSSFANAALILSGHAPTLDQAHAILKNALASNSLLDQERITLIGFGLLHFIERNAPAHARRLLEEKRPANFSADFLASVQRCIDVLERENNPATRIGPKSAIEEILSAPVDLASASAIGALLKKSLLQGNSPEALAALKSIKNLRVAASFPKSAPVVQLEWIRLLNSQEQTAAFLRKLESELKISAEQLAEASKILATLNRVEGIRTVDSRLHPAIYCTAVKNGVSLGNSPIELVTMLARSTTLSALPEETAGTLLSETLTASLPDTERVPALNALLSNCDADKPDMARRLDSELRAFLSQGGSSQSKTAAATFLAIMATFKTPDEEPADFLSAEITRHLPESAEPHFKAIALLQRNRPDEALSLLEKLPPERISGSYYYSLIREALLKNNRSDEAALFDQAVEELIKNEIGRIWLHLDREQLQYFAQLCRGIKKPALLSDSLFSHLRAQTHDPLYLLELDSLQSELREDWPKLKACAAKTLSIYPLNYESYFHLGLAQLHLGDKTEARKNLLISLNQHPGGFRAASIKKLLLSL